VPASIVPLTTTAGGNAEIGPKIVEGLLTYDYDLKPKPLLATACSQSKDGLQYTFALRKGVKWHDGKDFTSADVAFSILTLKQVHPRGRGTFANVVDVKTPDPHTAVIVLSKPSPFLLTALAATESPIVPKHLYEGTDIASSKYNSAPVGTGPFVFKEWVQGSHIILERNPDYWDKPKPYLDRVVVRFVLDAAARAAALESGAADLANGTGGIPLSDVERFRQAARRRRSTRASRRTWAATSRSTSTSTRPRCRRSRCAAPSPRPSTSTPSPRPSGTATARLSASPIGKGISAATTTRASGRTPSTRGRPRHALDAAGFKRGAGGSAPEAARALQPLPGAARRRLRAPDSAMYAARSASLGGLRAVRWNWRYSLETSALAATKARRRRWSALRPQCRTRCAHGQVRPWLVGVGRWVPQAAMAVTAERNEERDRISLFRYGFTVVIRTVIARI
jgi:peptide/nickel transport system substrate-binding protein